MGDFIIHYWINGLHQVTFMYIIQTQFQSSFTVINRKIQINDANVTFKFSWKAALQKTSVIIQLNSA